MCMPNHGRGRIRAAALHARHNQEDAPYWLLPYPDYSLSTDRDPESAEERDVRGGE
jgi:hypothetical protein